MPYTTTIYLAVVVLLICCSCEGYSTKCMDDSFFDAKRQKYLPCTECNAKNHPICNDCCSFSNKDTDAIYLTKPQITESVPSVKHEDTSKQNMVGLFFHILIIVMVVCTMSVIACVGVKAAKDRRINECPVQNNSHSHHHDATSIEEVWVSLPMQYNNKKSPTPVIGVVNELQEDSPKQEKVGKPML